MAEAANSEDREGAFPEKGKVESVCRKWLVHEDGVLAHKLQNEEMDFHYGLNRYNRRTVREDIPIAKLVQSEEEIRQQQERMEQLMLLKAQAEEDEKIAKSVMKDLDTEEAVRRLQKEVTDEDYARKMQEKERRRFERWKREQELKKERERLEQELARHSEEARLVLNKDSRGGDSLVEGGHGRQSSGDMDSVRVTAGGRIEDEGDFSDFYIPPADHMEEGEKKQLQELQDEELARLLQEQEHKRTKAEIDKGKLKQIEQQDAQLARIIHEQDKLKAKKARQKKQKSMEEARKQRGQQEALRSQSVDELGLGGGEVGSPNSHASSGSGTPSSHRSPREHNGLVRFEEPMSPSSPQSRGWSPTGHDQSSPLYRGRSPREEPPRRMSPADLPPEDALEVERWLGRNHAHSQSTANQRIPPRSRDQRVTHSPSPPGSYHSEDAAQENLRHNVPQPNVTSQRDQSPVPFNIAMAIDPTYRPQPQDPRPIARMSEPRPPLIQSQSYPVTSGPVDHEEELEEDYDEDDPGWAPVQGQRRSNMEKMKKVSKKPAGKRSSCKQQ
ncbi:GRB10-interacting GYF protein 2-like isoform X2 [Liolophura sinensis]|uniref:GRB10-interacting GYF protein 2-like isoform X2 n=1 Tax=Liolophura sinensis TaxID=3198878 RepID=UPI003158281A